MREDAPRSGTLREWWGLARYGVGDAGAVDAERLVAAVRTAGDGREGDRRRLLACRVLAQLAASDPAAVAPHVDDLVPCVDRDVPGAAAARAVCATGRERGDALDPLCDRLGRGGQAGANAAAGFRFGAELSPDVVAPAVEDLVAAVAAVTGPDRNGIVGRLAEVVTSSEDDASEVREPATRALGLAATGDDAVRSRLEELLTAGDPGRRACGALAIGRAVEAGCPGLESELPEVGILLSDRTVAVRRAATGGLAAAAAGAPGALDEETVAAVLTCPGGDRVDDRAAECLARVARADADRFEALADRATTGGSVVDALRNRQTNARERAVRALAGSADTHAERLATHPALQESFEVSAQYAARAVLRGARRRARRYGRAVGPLLDHTEAFRHQIWAEEVVFGALAELAREYPAVPETLVGRLADPGDDYLATTTAACAEVAAVAPDALLEADPGGDGEYRAAPLLREHFEAGRGQPGTALALARLGAERPAVVGPVAGVAYGRIRRLLGDDHDDDDDAGSPNHWGTAPGTGRPRAAGAVLTDATADDADEDATPFLASVAAVDPRAVETLVALVEDGDYRSLGLAVLAEAASDRPRSLASSVPALVAATETRVPGDRCLATRTLATAATAATAATGPTGAVRDRLVDLATDPRPSVRRWAAFGLGELADGADEREPLDGLRAVADRDGDDAGPEAALALVRASERPAADAVEALGELAADRDPPIAGAAVESLRDAGTPAAREALERASVEADDPGIRRRARSAADRAP